LASGQAAPSEKIDLLKADIGLPPRGFHSLIQCGLREIDRMHDHASDDSLEEKIRLLCNFGFHSYDRIIYIGTNGKMTEVCAAMELTSLESIETFIEINRRNYASTRRGLTDVPGVNLLAYDEREQANYQYLVCEVDEVKQKGCVVA
jgi:hypothetical protein